MHALQAVANQHHLETALILFLYHSRPCRIPSRIHHQGADSEHWNNLFLISSQLNFPFRKSSRYPFTYPSFYPFFKMPTQPLVGGLKHCHVTEELTPGDAYVMRFKNPMNEYKADLWIAIILPDTREPGNRLHRRPKGAKPENGPWTTPLSERAYPVYMPGRNS